MRKRKREIFSLSFLDIMACSFGSVLLIILVSKFNESTNPDLTLLNEYRTENYKKEDAEIANALNREITSLQIDNNDLSLTLSSLNSQLQKNDSIKSQITAEQNAKTQQASISNLKEEVSNVGGLKVNSSYVVIIIDVSGSMITCGPWRSVVMQIEEILNVFPDLEGFIVLSDTGKKLISGPTTWLKFNTTNKNKLKKLISSPPSTTSVSNPLVGLNIAITRYLRNDKVSFFILGDDIASYKSVEQEFSELEANLDDKKDLVSINGITFLTHLNCDEPVNFKEQNYRFSNLMRNLTFRYDGSLIQSKF